MAALPMIPCICQYFLCPWLEVTIFAL